MALALKQKKKIKPALQNLYNDLHMLKDGSWKPDATSVEATLDNVRRIAAECSLKLEAPDEGSNKR